MRLNEFADAEAQLALLHTIIDNTWTAIAQQAAEQKRSEAERKAQVKLKPRGKKRGKFGKVHIPSPPPPPPKKPNVDAKLQVYSTPNQPSPTAKATNPNALAQHPTAYPKPNSQPNSTVISPKPTTTPYPKATPIGSTKPSFDVKTGVFGRNIGASEKEDDGDDMYSKNGIAVLKKQLCGFLR